MVAKKDAASGWPMTDRAAFVRWVAATFGDSTRSDQELFAQQQFVRSFLDHEGPYRGLVLYHGLGSGKSCSAIATSEALRVAGGKTVHVMLPASLRANFVREIQLCGGEMFRRRQSWARVTDPEDVTRLRTEVAWLDPSDPRKRKAGDSSPPPSHWVPESLAKFAPSVPADDFRPFAEIESKSDIFDIQSQVDRAILRHHRFWHYNGNSPAEHRLATAPGAFDDSVVIIDEVHNFISNLHPEDPRGGKMAKAVYANLMAAKRCKIVMLSGTPLVNEPVELAWMVNLANGPVETFKVPLPSDAAGLTDENIEALSTSPHVHSFWEPASKDVADILRFAVQLLPEGFVRAPGDDSGTFVIRSEEFARADPASRMRLVLESMGHDRPDSAISDVRTLLPADADVFDATFVDYEALRIKMPEVLAQRCIGSISYFRGHDESLYPKLASVQTVRLELSGRQFTEYTIVRNVERVKEERSARFKMAVAGRGAASAASGSGSTGVGMRSASRAACTFVFPDGIQRPRIGDLDIDRDDVLRQKIYQAELAKAVEAVRERHREDGDTLLASSSGGRLGELSPKFDRIVQSLSDLAGEGTAIVYSEFRNTEGVEMLASAMEANGFQRLSARSEDLDEGLRGGGGGARRFIVYDGSQESEALLALFNNQPDHPSVTDALRRGLEQRHAGLDIGSGNLRGETATALLITRSGAEGISTRNVRQVHVIEPFWQPNRTEQVIGRARRAYSHDQLPEEDRSIDVFLYVASFSPEQAALHGGPRDLGLTSDEHVLSISERKRRLMVQLQGLMRSSAVDCAIWSSRRGGEEEPGFECFLPPDGVADEAPLFSSYSLQDDLAAARSGARQVKRAEASQGVRRRRDPQTGELIRA